MDADNRLVRAVTDLRVYFHRACGHEHPDEASADTCPAAGFDGYRLRPYDLIRVTMGGPVTRTHVVKEYPAHNGR